MIIKKYFNLYNLILPNNQEKYNIQILQNNLL